MLLILSKSPVFSWNIINKNATPIAVSEFEVDLEV
jgi:hypothetical protein